MPKIQNIETDTKWKVFYKVAGSAAFLIVLVAILDVALSMSAGEAKANQFIQVTEWFALFQTNPTAALSNLGMINIITLSLGLPLYLALYQIHSRANPSFAAFAAILFLLGTGIYISSNTIFSMLTLSNQYMGATDAQKPILEAAGLAALAQGADLTPGTFIGLFFTQLGALLMSVVMLRSGYFSKWAAWLGIFGFGVMLIFFTLAAFAPEQFSFAVLISMFGGLALMAYHILIARRLLQFSSV